MRKLCYGLFVVLLTTSVAFAQTGKITGQVTDGESGDALPGVNIILMGTELGAATDQDGSYTIINVPAGTYDIRASFIGYSAVTAEGVRVNIDLTTTQNFTLQPEALAGEEVVVEAATPVVQPDVSANIANVTAEEVESVPVAGVTEYIDLQAGVEPGMQIRGGGIDQVAFVVDGLNLRSGRSDNPFTGISYTAIDQFQVQTGGFTAEYGNLRSGLVNVVTKEGPTDRYTGDLLVRYAWGQKKHFGPEPSDARSYWMRPYVDDAVAWTGTTTDGVWDQYTRDSYPEFEGWNKKSDGVMTDDDPANDMTPEQAQQLFLFRRRKDFTPNIPGYQLDGSFGGPVPFVSRWLGNLRFFGSYRQTQEPYIIPMGRDRYWDQTGQLKLTSNMTSNMKLMVEGLLAGQYGMNPSQGVRPWNANNIVDGKLPQYPWNGRGNSLIDNAGGSGDLTWAYYDWNPMEISRNQAGGKFNHNLSPKTFYQVTMQRARTDYSTHPGPERNYDPIRYFGAYGANEAPQGWTDGTKDSNFDPTSEMRLGGHWGSSRDSSNVTTWHGRFDITSQVTKWNQLKAGTEFTYLDYNMRYGEWDPKFPHHENFKYIWDRNILQGGAYAQSKLEFQGMVANLGVRLDYYDPTQPYYQFNTYDRAFSPLYGFRKLDQQLQSKEAPATLTLSPRVGISYPITVSSKLYFNYGHFRQLADPQNLVGLEMRHASLQISQIGNPDLPMPRTVSYELGYDQNLFNQYLLRLSGYYKSVDDQARDVWFTSIDGQVDYRIEQPYNYADIRGFEISLNKTFGQWIRGFANYTYMVRKSGNFGFDHHYENDFQQRRYEDQYRAYYQSKPIPEPFARFNITFLTPTGYGPRLAGMQPLANWRINLLGEWRSGQVFTWAGGSGTYPGLSNNVRWKDFYMLDLRLAKNIDLGGIGRIQLYVDVDNVLNLKQLYRVSAFVGPRDFDFYMNSLQMPEEVFSAIDGAPYGMIPGKDRPGDYRLPGADFQPIEVVQKLPDTPFELKSRAWYYSSDNETYYEWAEGSWNAVDQGSVDQVLADKAYINMPNNTSYRFLNPRRIMVGFRVWF